MIRRHAEAAHGTTRAARSMFDDDLVICTDCRELSKLGRCWVAQRGERKDVASDYGPAVDLPRRCEFFAPKPIAADQRLGCERFPLRWNEYKARFPIAPIA